MMAGVSSLHLQAVMLSSLILVLSSYELRCPVYSEWSKRAEVLCKNMAKYFCLYNPLTNSFTEGCSGPDWDRPGSKRVFQKNFNRKACAADRFQPMKFSTIGYSICVFKRSLCSEAGQVVSKVGSSSSDNSCGCNFNTGYTFVSNSYNKYFCNPFKEDCSCFKPKCNITEISPVLDCRSTFTGTRECPVQIESRNSDRTGRNFQYHIHVQVYDILPAKWSHKYTLTIMTVFTICLLAGMTLITICCNQGAEAVKEVADQEFKDEIIDHKEEIEEALKTVDINVALNKVNKWKEEPVKFAVIGETGVGKTSFINTMLGFKQGQVSNFGNTTKKVTGYTYPGTNIRLYDMPGYGTVQVPSDKYESRVKPFDYVLIFMEKAVLREFDIKVANEIKKIKIPFCFVKSKLDEDLEKCKHDGLKKKMAVQNMRDAIRTSLNQSQFEDVPFFLITSRNTRAGDFDRLVNHIRTSLDDTKRETVMLSMIGTLSCEMIDTKYDLLKSRSWKIATLAASIAGCPVPGLDIVLNSIVIVNELKTYREAFGFDQDIVQNEIQKGKLEGKLSKNSILLQKTTLPKFVASQLKAGIALMVLQSYIDSFVLIIGSVLSAATAGVIVYFFLDKILKACKHDAELVYEELFQTLIKEKEMDASHEGGDNEKSCTCCTQTWR